MPACTNPYKAVQFCEILLRNAYLMNACGPSGRISGGLHAVIPERWRGHNEMLFRTIGFFDGDVQVACEPPVG